MAKLTQPEGGPPGLALGLLPPGPGLSAPHRASKVAEQSEEPGESNELCFVFLRESCVGGIFLTSVTELR